MPKRRIIKRSVDAATYLEQQKAKLQELAQAAEEAGTPAGRGAAIDEAYAYMHNNGFDVNSCLTQFPYDLRHIPRAREKFLRDYGLKSVEAEFPIDDPDAPSGTRIVDMVAKPGWGRGGTLYLIEWKTKFTQEFYNMRTYYRYCIKVGYASGKEQLKNYINLFSNSALPNEYARWQLSRKGYLVVVNPDKAAKSYIVDHVEG